MRKTIFFLLFIFHQFSYTQNNKIDSLKKLSFDKLKEQFQKTYVDTINDILYARAYLLKSKLQNDSLKMANGYFYLSEAFPLKKALVYADSIILVTKNKHSRTYPSLGYIQKGKLFYYLGKYKKSLSCFFTSLEHAKKNENQTYIQTIQNNIGIIKLRLGEKKEALEISKCYVNYLKKSRTNHKKYYLLNANLALANAYVQNKKNDSALIYINKGLKESLSSKDTAMYSHYLMLSGVNFYEVNKFKNSIDSLNKCINIIKNKGIKAMANLYLGKSLLSLRRENDGIIHLQKVDSFLNKTNDIIPELLDAYNPLIKYYKDKKDVKKQVYYLNNLLRFDSIAKLNNEYLSKSINEKYDVPNLLLKKNELISSLENKTTRNKNIAIALAVITFLFSFYFYRRNYLLKKSFNSVLQKMNEKVSIEVKPEKSKSLSTEISKDLLEKIINSLNKFEKSERFTKKKYTLNSLAKELNTNSSYLSKVINIEKNTNFSNYINNLKIDYAINRLTTDKIFRSYTIKAISEESGFNNQQTFSTAFYKKTKLRPSFFIKQLNKQI